MPATYYPTAQPWADQQYQAGVGAMIPYATQIPGQVIPGLETAVGNITNNPYSQLAQNAANAASTYGTGTLAPQMASGASGLFGAGNALLATGFDPQQALYNRTQQQVTDQSNAINAMYGLGSSPAGAGLTQQNVSNFNIDWQNAQLQRQATAAQGAGTAFSGGSDLGTAALGTEASAGALPYTTSIGQSGNAINALNALSGGAQNAFGLDQSTLNALSAYLKLGQSATATGITGANAEFNQQQTLGSQFGGALNSLASLYNKSSNPSTTGMPTGAPSTYGPGSYGTAPSAYGYSMYG